MLINLLAKSADAYASAVNYCRCSGLWFEANSSLCILMIDGVGSIDLNTLSNYGEVR